MKCLPPGKLLLFILGWEALFFGQDPYLEEMNRRVLRRIRFTVSHARAGAHSLRVASPDNRSVANAVAMRQGSFQDVGHDLHIAMPVGRKSIFRLHNVFIDHTQAPKSHVLRIVILIKRESVIGAKPTKIEMASLFGFANYDHGFLFVVFISLSARRSA